MEETMRAQMAATVESLMDMDNRVFVVLADISEGYFGLASRRHPNRIINVGIMEQTMISLAAGVALEGFIPVCHSIVPFLVERPFEQLKDDFCYQGLGGNFVSIGASYDYGTEGMTHHGAADVGILRTLPGMQIIVPGTAAEFDTLFRQAYANGSPTYFRTSTRHNERNHRVELGRHELVRAGSLATIIAVGPMLEATLAATEDLDVAVLYATTLVPFDGATLRMVAGNRSVMVVEPFYEGTMVADVVDALAPDPVRVEAIGVPRRVLSRYGTAEEHDAEVGLTPAGIRRRVKAFTKGTTTTSPARIRASGRTAPGHGSGRDGSRS
jgi:transketolase